MLEAVVAKAGEIKNCRNDLDHSGGANTCLDY